MNKRVKALRKSLGLTLMEFGKHIGIGASAVSAIETEKNSVTERTLSAILAAFPQVNPDWLKNGTGDMFREDQHTIISQAVARWDLPDIAREILEEYARLPEPKRLVVREYVQNIVASITAATAPGHPSDDDFLRELKSERSQAAESDPSADTDSNMG